MLAKLPLEVFREDTDAVREVVDEEKEAFLLSRLDFCGSMLVKFVLMIQKSHSSRCASSRILQFNSPRPVGLKRSNMDSRVFCSTGDALWFHYVATQCKEYPEIIHKLTPAPTSDVPLTIDRELDVAAAMDLGSPALSAKVFRLG